MRKFMSLFKNHIIHSAVIILITIIYVVSVLFIPYIFGKFIDLLIPQNVDFVMLYKLMNQAIILIIFASILNYIMLILNTRLQSKIISELKVKAFNKIFKMDINYFDTNNTGLILNNTLLNIQEFGDGLTLILNDFLRNVLTVIGVLVFMAIICYPIAIIVLLLTPLSILFTKLLSKKAYKYASQNVEARGNLTSSINEIVYNQKNITNYNYQNNAISSFEEKNEAYMETSFKSTFISSLVNPLSRFIFSSIYAIITLVAAIFIFNDMFALEIGMLSALLAYVNQYTKPFNEVTNILAEIQNAIASLNASLQYIEFENEKDLGSIAKVKTDDLSISFNHISFSYVKDHPLITDCSFEVKNGEKIAIVGPTGAGKTTLINLLMRFYDINNGDIKLGNNSIYEFKKDALRNQFGMVLQDTWIKQDTIYNNLTMGTYYPKEQIDEVLKACMLYDFVYQKPNGLQEIIGPDKNMSLGQRQLLCIARVMLKNANILLLDEATSNIDLLSEVKINDAFDKLMKGKTTFVVAHRFKTIKNANLIIVLNNGDIVEMGTHKELLERNGFYKELYELQYN